MNQRIIINGQEFDSPDALPPDLRRIYDRMMADRDGNGVPDVFEKAQSTGGGEAVTHHEVVIDSKTFTRLEDIPPELRGKVQQAFGRMISPDRDPAKDRGRLPASRSARADERSRVPALLIGAAIGIAVMLFIWLMAR
jgi:hypothetical protein